MNEELDHYNDSYSVPTGDHDNDSYSVPTGDNDNDSYLVPTGDHDNDLYSEPTGNHDNNSYSVKTTAKNESAEKEPGPVAAEPGPVAAVKSKTTQASCRKRARCRRHSFDTFRQSLSSPLSPFPSTHLAGRFQTSGGEQISNQNDRAGALTPQQTPPSLPVFVHLRHNL